MILAIRAAVGLVGVFTLLIGLGFLTDPVLLASQFSVTPVGTQGLATVRADFTAFFVTVAIFAINGAWRTRATPLLVPLTLLTTAFLGRLVSIVADGIVATTAPPMVVELVMIAVLLLAYRTFQKLD